MARKGLCNLVLKAKDRIEAKQVRVDAIIEAAEVPKRRQSSKMDHSLSIRSLYKTRVAILRKLCARNLADSEQSELKRQLSDIQLQVAETNRREALEKEARVAEEIKTNPKRFYQYANSFRKTKSKIGPLKTSGGSKTYESGPQKMAEILSLQYKSVFTTPRVRVPAIPSLTLSSLLENVSLKTEDMALALKSISTWSSAGPDGISAWFLRYYADDIAPALCALWKMSVDTGIMPDDINLAYITPLFKGGDKSDPANYRPVALTNHITKAFERVVKKEILTHLVDNRLLNSSQHGFTAGRSTLTNLIEYYESILLLLEHHQYVDAIYLDYSKAFDKCDHNIILDKLEGLGITGRLNHWISVFLKRRQQIVVVQGTKSRPVWCISGVPQGSVLGPLLFLILMLDITKGIKHSLLSSFADDTKVWKAIASAVTEAYLQEDLDQLYIWAQQNNMEFNSKKFQAIRFAEILSEAFYTNDVEETIEQSNLVKDLGIYFSSDMKFDEHVRIVANRGKRTGGWIGRVLFTRSAGVMLTFLKELIYPAVEYNCIVEPF